MKGDKKKIITSNQKHNKDTGSASVQIAIMTERIKELTEHLKVHKKDFHSRLGLVKLAGKRKKLLDYLSRKNKNQYQKLVAKLGIRVAQEA